MAVRYPQGEEGVLPSAGLVEILMNVVSLAGAGMPVIVIMNTVADRLRQDTEPAMIGVHTIAHVRVLLLLRLDTVLEATPQY